MELHSINYCFNANIDISNTSIALKTLLIIKHNKIIMKYNNNKNTPNA